MISKDNRYRGALLLILLCFATLTSFGYVWIETTVFGPKTYTRGTGDPQTFVDTFSVFNPDGDFRIHITNGEWDGDKRIEDATSSARVTLNGVELAGTNDFNKNVAYIDTTIATADVFHENILEVWMASTPGSKLKIEIFGTDQDTVPPVINIISPADGAFLNTTEPFLETSHYDDWMGIDVGSFSAQLDGTNITSFFSVNESTASYQIGTAEALTEGQHNLIVGISDLLGNSDYDTSNFVIDITPPVISVDYPPDGQTITEPNPLLQISYSDNLSGIDISTLSISVNGTDFTSSFTISDDSAYYQTSAGELLDGANQITVSVNDNAGNTTSVNTSFDILQFRAIATAHPTSGYAPLTVIFTQAGVDPSSTIDNYRWDFDGNGSWDTYDQVARQYTHTYHLSGTYNAVLRVQNSHGEYAYDTAVVTVMPTPPTATAEAMPSNGEAPLTVNFYGSGSDPDGSITLYEWDFDGDGTYDWSSTSTGNVSHTYTDPGTYSALFRVTDNAGLTGTATPILTEVRVGVPGSPTASASASPSSGEAPLAVNLTGTGTDPEGVLVLYEWDFDGDGTYDWSSTSTGNTSHTYDIPGTYYPAFRVTDGDGLTGTDYIQIFVGVGVNLVIPDDTFNPYSGETAIVRTTITAPIPVNIYLKTKEGDVIKTLVSNETRTAGTHDDVWDGTDDLGGIAVDGPYYAVLEYNLEGEWITYDLTNTTGGVRYLPTRQSTGGSQYNPRTIRPFEDEFLDIHFSTVGSNSYRNPYSFRNRQMGASEITCFVGYLWNVDMRIRTIVDREPYPAGSHVLLWDGLDDEGNIAQAPPGYYLILGFWAYTLPDNAIYLTGGRPEVTDLSADPNFLNAFDETCGTIDAGVAINYSVSEPGSVTLKVFDPHANSLVRSITQTGLPSGPGTIYWDGKNQAGQAVPTSNYQVGVVATDADGNQSLYKYTLVKMTF